MKTIAPPLVELGFVLIWSKITSASALMEALEPLAPVCLFSTLIH